ncbi:MAG: pilus assembly protein N-terminal domain-containing protein [Clostridia bacterium]|nr:pilus assembly protein N-terminal domain-containing protein [Clostridia bacterium]
MKKTWVKKTVVAVLALAMLLAVCGVALAAVTSVTINQPSKTDLAFNEKLPLTGSHTQDASDTLYYKWESNATNVATVVGTAATTGATAGRDSAEVTAGTTAGQATITYFVSTDQNFGTGATQTATLAVTVHELTVPTSDASNRIQISAGATYEPVIQYAEAGNYTLTSNTPAVASITSGNKIQGVSTGTAEITVASGNQSKTIFVQVIGSDPSLSVKTPSGNSSTNPARITLGQNLSVEIETNSTGAISWTSDTPTVASVSNVNSKTNTINGLTASGSTVKITATVAATATHNTRSVDIFVIVYNPATISVSKNAVSMAVNGTDSFMVDTNGSGNMIVTSADPTIATVNYPSNQGSGTVTVTGLKTGTTKLTVRSANSAAEQVINVTVGNPTPTITLGFNPDVSTLGYGDYSYLTIHVDNPTISSDGYAYVKLTRQNRRIYVENYNYSHPSTYVYWARLDASGNATVLVRPQYSGSTRLTVEHTGATAVYRNFTVTGYPTLPQTGQDFTLIYVLGACCLVAAGTWVIVYARKKKHNAA